MPLKVIKINDINSIVLGRHGHFLVNAFDAYVGAALIEYGEYCEAEWSVLSHFVKPGHCVIEVGANIGSHTVALAKAVGPRGRVVAIEPQRIIHQYLCANVALNSLDNVEAYWAGCGAAADALVVPSVDYFAPVRQNFGGVSLTADGDGEEVVVRTVDEILNDRAVHLIKIDVEGMELDVLKGAHRSIETHRPILYVENDRPEKSDSLIEHVLSLGYRAYWNMPRLYNPDNFFGVAQNVYPNIASINMLCLHRDHPWKIQGLVEIAGPGTHPLARQ